MGHYDVASENLSTQTSKGVFMETPPRLVHLVKVFNMPGPRGLPQTFDVWDEMENEMLFNKQPAMSRRLLNKRGQTLGDTQRRESRGCRPPYPNLPRLESGSLKDQQIFSFRPNDTESVLIFKRRLRGGLRCGSSLFVLFLSPSGFIIMPIKREHNCIFSRL